MLFMVCVSAFVPVVWVMAVGVGVFWWCCFQYCVAVVSASRRVPGVVVCVCVLVLGACLGVVWLVSGVSGVCVCVLVLGACLGVVWLVLGAWACVVGASVGVCLAWLCVLWRFRMLTCLASFFLLVLSFVLSCCLVNNGSLVVWAGACVL